MNAFAPHVRHIYTVMRSPTCAVTQWGLLLCVLSFVLNRVQVRDSVYAAKRCRTSWLAAKTSEGVSRGYIEKEAGRGSSPRFILFIMSQPTAILSVYDKTGLIELAQGLAAKGVRLLSSGGTARAVRNAGIEIG